MLLQCVTNVCGAGDVWSFPQLVLCLSNAGMVQTHQSLDPDVPDGPCAIEAMHQALAYLDRPYAIGRPTDGAGLVCAHKSCPYPPPPM